MPPIVTELGRRGSPVEAVALATVDELTDLLAKLQGLGVTHVFYDPGPKGAPIPISRAIIDLEVAG